MNHLIYEQVVFIGAGNVATHLSQAMQNAGYHIRQVYSRSIDNAKILAELLKCSYTNDIKNVNSNADLYIFSLADDALPAAVAAMPQNNGLWIHTAGSVPLDVFCGYTKRYGVMYPLQTFSKQRKIDFSKVPLFIEANTPDEEDMLYDVAGCLSNHVIRITSEKRKYLHLAAVFACTFSNHLYTLAAQILGKQGVDWRLFQPLIIESTHKLYDMSPVQAQTGPAVRDDHTIMEQHLSMLEDEYMRKIYSLISESIHTHHNKESQ